MLALTTSTIETPPPSPAEIAAGVRVGAAFQVARARLAELRQRRDALGEEARTLRGQLDRPGSTAPMRIAEIEDELRRLADEITVGRRAAAPMRAKRAAAVVEALRPTRVDAAHRLLHAAADLRAALATLAETVHELEVAGGEVAHERWTAPDALGHLEAEARRLAEAGR